MQVAFNQHQLNLVSCCVYSAARVLGAAVPFRRINEAIAAVFPLQDAALFAQADIGVTGAPCCCEDRLRSAAAMSADGRLCLGCM